MNSCKKLSENIKDSRHPSKCYCGTKFASFTQFLRTGLSFSKNFKAFRQSRRSNNESKQNYRMKKKLMNNERYILNQYKTYGGECNYLTLHCWLFVVTNPWWNSVTKIKTNHSNRNIFYVCFSSLNFDIF